MQLSDIRPSITTMPYDGVLAIVIGVRESRQVRKAQSVVSRKRASKEKPKVNKMMALLDGLSDAEKERLAKMIEGQ